MNAWSDLKEDSGPVNTFAYWLLAERKRMNPEKIKIDDLYGWFSLHYDIEEQAYSRAHLHSTGKYNKFLQPVSPITLAKEWAPFPLAAEILGSPEYSIREEDRQAPFIFEVFQGKFLGGVFPEKHHNLHERHFIFLLRLVTAYAEQFTGRIFLMGSAGWSYDHEVREDIFMNPQVSVALHQSGYLYTERLSGDRG